MEIINKSFSDPGFPPVECTCLKVDENTFYYFIQDGNLANGNIIVTPNYKEAIGHEAYSSLGVINSEGKVLIPFENKTIKVLKDKILLVEKNIPTTDTVVEALKNKNDPFAAQTYAQNAATIKKQMKDIMGMNAGFIFDNQFSEAALYTLDGVNVANQYFSFIGENNGDYYLASNVVGATIMKFNPNQLFQEQESNMQQAPTLQKEQVTQQPNMGVDQPPKIEASQASSLTPNIDIPIQNMEGVEQPPIVNTEQQQALVSENPPNQNTAPALDINHSEVPNPEVKLDIEVDQEENKQETTFENESPQIELSSANTNTLNIDDEEEIEDSNSTDESETSVEAESESFAMSDETEDKDSFENDDDDDDDMDEEDSYDEEDDELEEDEEVQDSYDDDENEDKDEEIEEKSTIEQKKDPYNIEEEDIKNPTILDATNTIKKLLEETRNQRYLIDKQIGEIETLKSTVEIISAERDSAKLESQSMRHERDDYRTKYIDLTRQNTKLKGALSRYHEIVHSQDEQITGLKGQVAGMHALSNAINEANVLVQPVEDNKVIDFSQYQASNADIDQYLNSHYVNNNRDIDQDYSYFTGKHQSSSSNTNEGEQSYRRSRAA